VKLLLDENLSPLLIGRLSDLYPDSAHVHQCQLGGAHDTAIWEYAKNMGFAIVSKDSDFAERSVLFGAPQNHLDSQQQPQQCGDRRSLAHRVRCDTAFYPGSPRNHFDLETRATEVMMSTRSRCYAYRQLRAKK
jgi:hypothetical protein